MHAQTATPTRHPAPRPVFSRSLGSWHVVVGRHGLDPARLDRDYDRIAPGWHPGLCRTGHDRAYRALLSQVLNARPLPPTGGRVPAALDCGTGTGEMLSALAAAAGPVPLRATGLDRNGAMLDEARRRLAADGVPATLVRADLRRMPFAADSFDLVMAAHALEHLPDPLAALREMARVARPGATVLLVLTRRSLAGLWVHLRWRNALYSREAAAALMLEAGLTGLWTPDLSAGPLARFSLAIAGRRPDTAPEGTAP